MYCYKLCNMFFFNNNLKICGTKGSNSLSSFQCTFQKHIGTASLCWLLCFVFIFGFFYACVPHYPNKRVCIYCLSFLFVFLSQHLLFLLNTCFYSWTLSSAAFVDILKAKVQVFLWVHIIPTPWQLSLNSAALLRLPEFHIVIVTCSQLWLTHHVDDFGYNRKLLPVLKHGLLTKHDDMYRSRYSP